MSGLQPFFLLAYVTQGFALGYYGADRWLFKTSTKSRGLDTSVEPDGYVLKNTSHLLFL